MATETEPVAWIVARPNRDGHALEQLRDHGPAQRPPRSHVGYDCMQLGWTEWDTGWLERITDAGRKAIEERTP